MKPGANQMKKTKLCLIGCGWLGKPLAKHLIAKGYSLLATTAHDKNTEFSNELIPYLRFDLTLSPQVTEEILNADILIYTIPPLELHFIKIFFDQIPIDKKIIFTSSTSVYGKDQGPVNETFIPAPASANSPLLVQTEEYLRQRFKQLTIIRPGGLYGEKRHPIFFLQGKSQLTTGKELLHLVHLQDCINAILKIIDLNIWNETINLVSDLRIEKKEYYVAMAKKLKITPPTYIENQIILNPTNISNEKSKKILMINYSDPNQF
jgi:nucleoside-diphosphate-sugar epimerase